MIGITEPKMSESSSIPKTYIHCTVGPLTLWMEPFAARARNLKWNVHTITVDHDVMITHAKELAEILLRITNK